MPETTIADIEAINGYAVLELGTSWCEHCQNAQPYITEALSHYPDMRHIKIEDGKGKHLGRSYSVKLWPTLIILYNGRELDRIVRPGDMKQITHAFDLVTC